MVETSGGGEVRPKHVEAIHPGHPPHQPKYPKTETLVTFHPSLQNASGVAQHVRNSLAEVFRRKWKFPGASRSERFSGNVPGKKGKKKKKSQTKTKALDTPFFPVDQPRRGGADSAIKWQG